MKFHTIREDADIWADVVNRWIETLPPGHVAQPISVNAVYTPLHEATEIIGVFVVLHRASVSPVTPALIRG